jgi:hypothetical protein
MVKHCIIVLFLCVGLGSAWAAELREIELRDGSVLRGEIVSLENGTYTIRSDSLGEMRISASDVRVIRFAPPDRLPAPESATAAQREHPESDDINQPVEDLQHSGDLHRQLDDVQRSLATDDSIMQIITSLHDDPDVQSVLSDPKVMQAMQTGDLPALMANPKLMELLANPKIQEIQRRSARNR